ncbi:aldolase/citrate lyase family protein [Minwuia thermotolerans]|uniref:Aldolase n=1 Tax=Minwuia thermotolerans TaxID=2056226 RepID=A0A2M9G271_9PROT|nr:aldolase/citrate lyase family protein [Minwuia thermotolerans]PJK29822.1 aldolase [Minwuia thermotolerans]
MIRLMVIPESPEMAAAAARGGVDRIFVDLERSGKFERQGGGTWISEHGVEEIARYRRAAPDATLLVRLDPWPSVAAADIERVLDQGADMLMLPMITTPGEVGALCRLVAGRAPVVPLIETVASADRLPEICAIEGVGEIFIGLNDLHRQRGDRFMFEPLADGAVERLGRIALEHGLSFGFGGMARIGRGDLPAEWILGEHVRLGSTAVILSRSFKATAGADFDWGREVGRIRDCERDLAARTPAAAERDRQRIARRIAELAAAQRAAG